MNPSTKKLHLHDFSSRLRAALDEAGATQLALAKRLKTDQGSVSRWLAGKARPFEKTIPEIAYALGVRTEWLRDGEGERLSDESLAAGGPVVRLMPLNVGMQAQPEVEQTAGTRILRWRTRHGYTIADAAKVLGIGVVKLREIEETGRQPSPTLLAKFEALEFESATVAETIAAEKYARLREERHVANGISARPPGESRSMKVRQVPVIGWAKAGEAMDFEDVVDWETPVSVETNDAKAFAIRVKGDSMSPRICEGDLVVVSPSEPPRNEKPVVVRLRVQGILLKQFHRLTPQTFELRSLNPFYSPVAAAMSDVVWIYPVVAIINYP